MRILLFHPTLLPPKDYGGVERVVLWLTRGLRERGHEVFVAASEGSELPLGAKLIAVEKKDYSAEEISQLLPPGIDVMHFMAPLSSQVWEQLRIPALLTVHGNGKPGEKFPLNTVFLSSDHAKRHSSRYFIFNGIDPAEYVYTEKKSNSYLFLSKTSWRVKNLSGAMAYCRKAKVPLKVAGGNRPYLKKWECWLRPDWKWEGAVSGVRKAELLSQAKALIFPVLWPEPFGLVVAEALMSGTPVIASPRGSLRELLPSHVGGLPETEDQWIEFLHRPAHFWTSQDCRSWALENFHYSKMAAHYEDAYRKVIQGEVLNSSVPVAGNWRQE